MCKAPVSAILGLPLEWHTEKAPVSPRHAEQQQLQPWSSTALSQGSCSGETRSALTFWELKPRSSGTHSHYFSFNTIHCPCHLRSTAKCPVLQPFLGSTLSGQCRSRQGAVWACGGSTVPAQSKPGRATAQPQTTRETSGSSKLDNPAKPCLRLLQIPAQHS